MNGTGTPYFTFEYLPTATPTINPSWRRGKQRLLSVFKKYYLRIIILLDTECKRNAESGHASAYTPLCPWTGERQQRLGVQVECKGRGEGFPYRGIVRIQFTLDWENLGERNFHGNVMEP